MNNFEWVGALTPAVVAITTLIVVLARMHYSIESLAEKVKILFDFHNKRQDNDRKN